MKCFRLGYAISKMPDPPGEPALGPENGSDPTDSPPPPPPPPVPIMPGCEFGATLFSESADEIIIRSSSSSTTATW